MNPHDSPDTESSSQRADEPFAHPERIGPYRILQVIGEGGMGVVYDAEQVAPVQRRVALKMMKVGMDTKEVVARFEAERQALAVMDHPGIARVLDAGATEAGRPYFVMERVQGIPLNEYCDLRKMGLAERLRLFVSICQAVQHAHQKGVIHRDLKPSNVLVTEQDGKPVPKIIDFGIAKAISQRLTEKTLVTAYGIALGTPAYMSPEQAEMSGLDIDTRTDIYSLGVILYELLSGELPIDPKKHGLQGFIAQLIARVTDAPTPSARVSASAKAEYLAGLRGVSPGALQKELKGDLDWIVLKAMDKDRTRRYETANGFAMDLERYLANEPVAARPPSARYRVSKFVRRNRAAVIAASAVVIALVAGVILATAGTIRAQRAERVAEVRRTQAEELISFMVGDLQGQLSSIARLDLLDDVADRALQYFAAVPADELSGDEIAARAQTLTQIGSLRVAQGELSKATAAYQQALVLMQELARRDPGNSAWQLELAAAYFWVGYARYRAGDLGGALEPFREYLAIAERNATRNPEDLQWQVEVGYAHSNIAMVLQDQGDLEGALYRFRLTMDAERRALALEPDNTEYQLSLANSHNTVGDVLNSLGRLEEALVEFRQEIALKEALVAADSTNTTFRAELAKGHNYVGDALQVLGHVDSALTHFERAVALLEDLVAYDSENVQWRRALATNLARVGYLHRARGERTRALPYATRRLSLITDIVETAPDDPRYQRDLASAHRALATALSDAGQTAQAANSVNLSVETLEAVLDRNPDDRQAREDLAATLTLAGTFAFREGSQRRAREHWSRAVELVEPIARGTTDHGLLTTLVRPLLHLDRLDEAHPILVRLDSMGYVSQSLTALRDSKGLAEGGRGGGR